MNSVQLNSSVKFYILKGLLSYIQILGNSVYHCHVILQKHVGVCHLCNYGNDVMMSDEVAMWEYVMTTDGPRQLPCGTKK